MSTGSVPGTLSIPRRVLGGTGLKVSVLGFGASPLGGVFRQVTEQQCTEAVHEAVKLGINFFDTSPFYGETKSEEMLGKALRTLPVSREEIIVCSKVGRYGETNFDFSRTRVLASIQESFDRLGLDYLDIVYCHDIEFGDLDQIINETIPTLRELQAQGKIRFVGVSGLPLKALSYVVQRTPVDVILSYCHYTLLDTSLVGPELLPLLKQKNIGIVNASPLCMGILTPGGGPSWHPAPQSIQDAVAQAREVCESNGINIAELALKFAFTCEDVSATLIGMCSVEEVRRNFEATVKAFQPTKDEAYEKEQEVLNKVREIFKSVDGITWPSGKPENN
eukprot:TRINITY_DN3661_c0_g1_i6.p1 TRINITY_DN3661_c0_g1~~TRINITY_DN3661_c0_g1_i6.p1  ORF type:complete len:335 (+),score=55.71 TRINITY_DN3661_c0_g1_i6:119-1123(+)